MLVLDEYEKGPHSQQKRPKYQAIKYLCASIIAIITAVKHCKRTNEFDTYKIQNIELENQGSQDRISMTPPICGVMYGGIRTSIFPGSCVRKVKGAFK